MITFSIITCTFQAEKEIQRTLESVAQQTYPHVEHVLVDGASRDQTTTLIEAYIAEQRTQPETLHRTVYRSEPDKGLYDAMNKGLQRATGDYVLFLNAGDTLSKWLMPLARAKCCPVCSMATPMLWTTRGVFCAIAVSCRPKTCHGATSNGACWCAIKPFMPAQTLHNARLIVCSLASRPTWIGASV